MARTKPVRRKDPVMMEYELFKKLIPERIHEYLPPVYHKYTPDVRQVEKVNETKDAFCMMPPDKNPMVAIPTLYLDDLYRDFALDEDLERVLGETANVIMTWSGIEVPELADFTLEKHTDKVIVNLISRSMNKKLLANIPHRDFLDMAVIYRLVQSINEQGINSAIITNEILSGSGLDADELHRLALENTPRMMEIRIYNSDQEGVYVVTNRTGICGAAAMLYKEEMRRIAKLTEGDFFILPSSIHEFFAIDAKRADPDELVKMLAAGNQCVTRPQEQLSNVIYRYDARSGKILKEISYFAG